MADSFLVSRFTFEKLLNEDTRTKTVILLGKYAQDDGSSVPALLTVEKLHFPGDSLSALAVDLGREELLGQNDVYYWAKAAFVNEKRPPDVKLSLIQPATEVHVRKAMAQTYRMVTETPAVYKNIVEPYINSFPPERLQWVYNILEKKKEAERIVCEDPDPETGFIVAPDLKWDQINTSALYLVCIVQNRSIRSLRDLRPKHLPLLRKIKAETEKAAMEKYGVQAGELRSFIHYQPSYYHLHVHIIHVSLQGFSGSIIGQCHLLEDVIDNLEMESAETPDEDSFYARKTLTYALGDQHGLYSKLVTPA